MATVQPPAFPLSAVELSRFSRFAARGGIGKATALVDREAETASELMFLSQDEIVVLMCLPNNEFIGSCEGVVGTFAASDVKIHGKLKKAVMTPRRSDAGSVLELSKSTASTEPSTTPDLTHSPQRSEDGSSEAVTPPATTVDQPFLDPIKHDDSPAASAVQPELPTPRETDPTLRSHRTSSAASGTARLRRTQSADSIASRSNASELGNGSFEPDVTDIIFDSYRYSLANVGVIQGMDVLIPSKRNSRRYSRRKSSNGTDRHRGTFADIPELDDAIRELEEQSWGTTTEDRVEDWRRRFGAATEIRQRAGAMAPAAVSTHDEDLSKRLTTASMEGIPRLRDLFPRSSTSSSLQSLGSSPASRRPPALQNEPLRALDTRSLPSPSTVASSPHTPLSISLPSPSAASPMSSLHSPARSPKAPASSVRMAGDQLLKAEPASPLRSREPSTNGHADAFPWTSPSNPRSDLEMARSRSDSSVSNKLRKRPKQVQPPSPSVEHIGSPTEPSSAFSGVVAFLESPRPAPVPTFEPKSPSIVQVRRSSSYTRLPAVKADYGLPVSSKDFQEESVRLGATEFEIVKPLAEVYKEESNLGQLARFNQSAPAIATSRRSEWDVDAKEAQSHRARESKWLSVLSLSAASLRKSKKVKSLIEAGTPSSLRGRVWHQLSGADEFRTENLYYTLSCVEEHQLDHYLDELSHLSSSDASHSLRDDAASVLTALINYDRSLLPYRGLVTAISALLQTCPAEMAFWILVAISQPDGLLRPFFVSRERERAVNGALFDLVLANADPALSKRLQSMDIGADDFVHAWAGSLFARVLSPETTMRAVDLLIFDSRHWVRIAYAVLASCRPYLLDERLRREQALHVLLNPPHSLLSPSQFVNSALGSPVKDDKLRKFRKKAEERVRANW